MVIVMSTQTVKIGTQTITPEVKDQGETILLTFTVQMKSYKGGGQPHPSYPTTINVQYLCQKYKTVTTGQFQTKRVEKILQECVNEWINLVKDVYEFV